ncbi:MAG: energy-coupling factor transporter ATPase [Eubacteriales bacterium]|nr:energy-coupling factor transporter ATPase [Eubacteriales bacterium]
MSEIKAENLRHVYSAGTPFEKVAIDGINVTIPQGQMVGVIGHTGSGKSTFIQHLNALLQPSSGRVFCGGQDINADKISRRDVKWKVGLVFQYPEYQLFEETVYKDIAFGPRNMKLGEEEIDRRVREAASFVGVDEELFESSPLELSGGQKRRIAIAGVIAMRPEVLILDEPTAGLDPAGCEQILENICDYREKTGATVLIVSHNMDDVARLSERIIVFDHGKIAMDGTPEEIFSQPERLISMGLTVPHSTAVAMELRRLGLELPETVYTHEKLLSAVIGAGEVGKC